ncbi:MAG: efflux RND transporter permease subunit [Candidatus Electronema sp. V4]|uniref:efflux RND transporter permease subunit n=1 Tax=Candidatus Electronema sp. V4 TaxID=3454756 RepID=UPI0040556845
MKFAENIIGFAVRKPKAVVAAMLLATLAIGAFIVKVHVDTDPENMLSENEHVRVFHDLTKKEFGLHDVVVLGVVNEKHPDGVFNPETLKKAHVLSKFAATLADPKDPARHVVGRDIIAPDNVDNILQAGLGQVRFEWLMQEPPTTREEALKIRDYALANPLLKGTMVSEDGKALAIYLPITKKDFAHTVAERLRDKIEELGPAAGDEFHITGLPVAEDTFGKEMFIQMAISAPMAMLMIFALMYYFFRNVQLITAPMILAFCSVIITMGLLIGTGHTLHIMSSMIPIFIMPIAVTDSVHILSEFFDTYHRFRDKGKAILHVMRELFVSMFFTSLTSAAGFASLATTPIPPIQAFGIFVGIGIMIAWALTMLFIPAYVMLIPESKLENFGAAADHPDHSNTPFNRHLRWIGKTSSGKPWLVIGVNIGIMIIGVIGISMIQVNDNPVKWFKKSHEVRVADRVLNSHFGGTYEAYLVLSGKTEELSAAKAAELLKNELEPLTAAFKETALKTVEQEYPAAKSGAELLDNLTEAWNAELDNVPAEDEPGYEFWTAAVSAIDKVRARKEIFKRPDLLRWIADFQAHLAKQGDVGKSNTISDVVKKVHQELYEGDPKQFIIPDTVNAVAETLISFQSSHKPDDLLHLVTPDYTKANLWLQLRSGDNKDMERVIKDVEQYFAKNPPPVAVQHEWAGLTYINVIWQQKMTNGMMSSFLSSFVMVFLMMVFMFRSIVWGLLSMIPLTFTIVFIYGVLGLIGKDYDMPVAVLSSLTLGLAVDFAIHFLQRTRMTMSRTGSWDEAVRDMFDEPARAILRNIIVIAVGFTPLLLAPLVPYQTVGIFLASIMFYSGFATLWILPALLTVMKGWVFKKELAAFAKKG